MEWYWWLASIAAGYVMVGGAVYRSLNERHWSDESLLAGTALWPIFLTARVGMALLNLAPGRLLKAWREGLLRDISKLRDQKAELSHEITKLERERDELEGGQRRARDAAEGAHRRSLEV